MINLLNDTNWKETHATCSVQHADDLKRDRETRQRIVHNTVPKKITRVSQLHQFTHADGRKNKRPATHPEETSPNSIGHGTQISTRTRTHNSFQSRANACRDLLQKSWTFAPASHHNSWTFVPDHPTISIWRFDHTFHPLTCLLATFPLLTNVEYSSYDAGTITPNWNVSCMDGIHNGIQHAPSAMRVHFSNFQLELVCTFSWPSTHCPVHHTSWDSSTVRISLVLSHLVYASACLPSLCSLYLLQSHTSRSIKSCSHKILEAVCFMRPTPRLWKNACAVLLPTLISISWCPIPTNINTSCNNSASLMPSDAAITSASQLLNATEAWPSLWACNLILSAMITAPLLLCRVTWSLAHSESV